MGDLLAPGGRSGDARRWPSLGRRLAHLPIAIIALVLAPLAAGTVVRVPIPIPAPPPPAEDFDEIIELAADIEPVFAPPSLTTTVTGCLADVAVKGGSTEADGFALYEADPSSLVFANVKTSASAGGTSYQTEVVTGTHVFSASAFIGSIEVQSDPVVVEIPEGCEGNGWTGDATIVGGKLLVGQAVDQAYFYASIDGGPFGRVPVTPGVFIEPQIGGLDVTPYFGLPAGAEDLQIDAWGWQGSKLVKLGSGHWELDRIGSAECGIGTTLDGLYKKVVIAHVDDGPADDMRLAAMVERASDREWAAEAAVSGGADERPVAGVPTPTFGTGSETVTLYRSSTVERPYDENGCSRAGATGRTRRRRRSGRSTWSSAAAPDAAAPRIISTGSAALRLANV